MKPGRSRGEAPPEAGAGAAGDPEVSVSREIKSFSDIERKRLMSIFKCKMCGGDLEIAEGASVAECPYLQQQTDFTPLR